MTQPHRSIRLATSAIAVALALSATPLIAQEVPPDPTSSTPVTTTTDPLAPDPAATESVTPAPATTTKTTRSKPATTTRSKTTTRTASATRAPARPAATAAPAAAPAETATAPPAPPVAEPAPPAPATPAPAAPASQLDMNQVLPLAGAVAITLLALAGAIWALRRRKRRREEAEAEEQWQAEQAQAEPVADPIFAEAAPKAAATVPKHDPVVTDKPTTELPEGFDLSRFGPHVRAAYLGPTPDNPSLSLRYRLRKATALDQRERAAGAAAVKTRPAETPAQRQPVHTSGDFMLRRDGSKAPVGPAYRKAS